MTKINLDEAVKVKFDYVDFLGNEYKTTKRDLLREALPILQAEWKQWTVREKIIDDTTDLFLDYLEQLLKTNEK